MTILIALFSLIILLDTTTAPRIFVIASLVLTAVMLCLSLVLLRTAGRKDNKKESRKVFNDRTAQLPPEADVFPEHDQEQLLEKAN